MTPYNWNDLTPKQSAEITKVLAVEGLGWKSAPNTAWYPCGGFILPSGETKIDFDPLTDIRHTAMVWAALSTHNKLMVVCHFYPDTPRCDTLMFSDILDPLKLSQAIYTVLKGEG